MNHFRRYLAAGCCAALLASGGILSAYANVITAGEEQSMATEVPDSIGVWGTVISAGDGRIYLDNISGNSSPGEIVINVSGEGSRVVEGVNGFPVSPEDLKPGDFIYAYLGPVMTMSLPPQTQGQMVICKVPEGQKVPEYIRVTGVQAQEDGSVTVTGNNGNTYQIPADSQILPFLTRNIVTIQDIAKDRTCMIWSDENNQATKVVLFPQEIEA